MDEQYDHCSGYSLRRKRNKTLERNVLGKSWLFSWFIHQPSSYFFLFLSGFLPRVIKVAPACAIMISTYEFGKAFFRKHNEEERRRGGDVRRSIAAELHDRFHPNWPAFSSALACVLVLISAGSGQKGWSSRVQFDNAVQVLIIYLVIYLFPWDVMYCIAVRLQHTGAAQKHAGKTAILAFICMHGCFEGILFSGWINLGCEMVPGSMWSSYICICCMASLK